MESKEMMIVLTAVTQNSVLTRRTIPYHISNFKKPSRVPRISDQKGFPLVSYNVHSEPIRPHMSLGREQSFHTVCLSWTLDTAIYTMLEENESDIAGVEGVCDMLQPRNIPQLRT